MKQQETMNMNFPTVLVVNNSSHVLTSTRDYLELRGYKVLAAENEDQAERHCSEEVIHVAVVDIRLVDDTDDNDESGLRLAARLSPSIYKIILTGQEHNDPKKLLLKIWSPDKQGGRLAADFTETKNGPENLLEKIQIAFSQHINLNINKNFNIRLPDGISWSSLVEVIKIFRVRSVSDPVRQKAEDVLQDLFRRLFYKADMVQVWSILPGHSHCLVVLAKQTVDGVPGTDLAVKFGPHESIYREEQNYKEYVLRHVERRADLESGPVWSREMGALAYSFIGGKDRSVTTFLDYYLNRDTSSKQIKETLSYLFENSCRHWYAGRRPSVNGKRKRLDLLYRSDLNLIEPAKVAELKDAVEALIQQHPLGDFSFARTDDAVLIIRIAGGPVLHLPDPVSFIFDKYSSDRGETFFPIPAQEAITHGDLHTGNIIVSTEGRAWLIDFYRTGWGHVLRDFAELESDVKFTSLQSDSLLERYDIERALLMTTSLNSTADELLDHYSCEQARAIETIRHIRNLAYQLTETESTYEYNIALLCYAIKRIVGFTSARQCGQSGLNERYHALLSAAMICNNLLSQMNVSREL